MTEKKVYKQRKRKDFAVWVPDSTGAVRQKLERMAEGAMDGLGPIVRDLIIEADETAPRYQKRARLEESSKVAAVMGIQLPAPCPAPGGPHDATE